MSVFNVPIENYILAKQTPPKHHTWHRGTWSRRIIWNVGMRMTATQPRPEAFCIFQNAKFKSPCGWRTCREHPQHTHPQSFPEKSFTSCVAYARFKCPCAWRNWQEHPQRNLWLPDLYPTCSNGMLRALPIRLVRAAASSTSKCPPLLRNHNGNRRRTCAAFAFST